MGLDSGAVMTLYILISSVLALAINIIFYRLVFKKKKRLKANTFSWLTTLGIIAPVNFALIFILVRDVSTGTVGGAIGFGLAMTFIIPPIFWFVPATLYSLIRAIYIAITRKREREILQEDIQEIELDVEPILAQRQNEF